ncbi:copper amine oxidase N-terminal domain-containing protein [Cohnella terricola]|uniref:Copper amine oxidase N-terminal domain-containing protein n=1 Tax=Cohnella terricola TaxID=1289167 RepID=A0A559JFK5_9BACL|nr:copper amine oxidase N-terminal domain-containing protein [Cohnella terricola]TVX98646.1 copper amine oxidase N-terminal domain-containing protein [Cohnella terricola]
MLKKITIFVLVLLLAVPYSHSFALNDKSTMIFADGKRVVFNIEPITEKGIVYVEVKPLMKALGATLSYDSKTKNWIGKNDKYTFSFKSDSDQIIINGKKDTINMPKIVGGSTFIPVRMVKKLGHGVTTYYNRIIIGPFYKTVHDDLLDVSWEMTTQEVKTVKKEKIVSEVKDGNETTIIYQQKIGIFDFPGKAAYVFINNKLESIRVTIDDTSFNTNYKAYLDFNIEYGELYGWAYDYLKWNDEITKKAYFKVYGNDIEGMISAAITARDLKLFEYHDYHDTQVSFSFSNVGSIYKPHYITLVLLSRKDVEWRAVEQVDTP